MEGIWGSTSRRGFVMVCGSNLWWTGTFTCSELFAASRYAERDVSVTRRRNLEKDRKKMASREGGIDDDRGGGLKRLNVDHPSDITAATLIRAGDVPGTTGSI